MSAGSGTSRTQSGQALEDAAQWFALLRSGEATDADYARWQAWLDASPEHQAVWRKVEHISGRLDPIVRSPARHHAASAFKAASAHGAQRRRVLLGLAGLAGSGLSGWTAWRADMPGFMLAWMADHRTSTGEIRQVSLTDGTQVWLASASAFSTDYRHDLRRLKLVAGEILIQTASHGARHDFVVDTPQGRLRALGTRFTVRLEADRTFVAVYEGAVEIQPGSSATASVLPAGEQTRFTRLAAQASTPADPAREAWSRGILVTQDTPLGDVVAELRRYRHGHIAVAPEIARLPVFGSYPISDVDRTLAMLETVMPIRVNRPFAWWVSIEPR